MGIRGVGKVRASALADLLHEHKDQLSSTFQVEKLLRDHADALKTPHDVLERLASLVGFAPAAHQANKRASLQDIRPLAVACTIPSYNPPSEGPVFYTRIFLQKVFLLLLGQAQVRDLQRQLSEDQNQSEKGRKLEFSAFIGVQAQEQP